MQICTSSCSAQTVFAGQQLAGLPMAWPFLSCRAEYEGVASFSVCAHLRQEPSPNASLATVVGMPWVPGVLSMLHLAARIESRARYPLAGC
jgi:hypothetical protein